MCRLLSYIETLPFQSVLNKDIEFDQQRCFLKIFVEVILDFTSNHIVTIHRLPNYGTAHLVDYNPSKSITTMQATWTSFFSFFYLFVWWKLKDSKLRNVQDNKWSCLPLSKDRSPFEKWCNLSYSGRTKVTGFQRVESVLDGIILCIERTCYSMLRWRHFFQSWKMVPNHSSSVLQCCLLHEEEDRISFMESTS